MKQNVNKTKISVILLAGGLGTRMQSETPKQFIQLADKPIARYSFDLFLSLPEIDEIVVVCAPPYHELFKASTTKSVVFALPGNRRQDSVYNGLIKTSPTSDLICVHDSARPFIDEAIVKRTLEAGHQNGAATTGMPIKFTVKERDHQNFVRSTPDRSMIWEIQTPQVIQRDLLLEGFRHAHKHNLTVTDDVSLVELLGKNVKLVEGSHTNLKVTVSEDLAIAVNLLAAIKN